MLSRIPRNVPSLFDPVGGAMSTLRELQSTMDSLFNELWRSDVGTETRGFIPPVNIFRTNDHLTVECLLPGVKKDDVQISLEGDVLNISGQIRSREEIKEENVLMREVRHGAFQRSIRLPLEVDPNQIKARMDNGMLHITLTLHEKARSKQVKVKID